MVIDDEDWPFNNEIISSYQLRKGNNKYHNSTCILHYSQLGKTTQGKKRGNETIARVIPDSQVHTCYSLSLMSPKMSSSLTHLNFPKVFESSTADVVTSECDDPP